MSRREQFLDKHPYIRKMIRYHISINPKRIRYFSDGEEEGIRIRYSSGRIKTVSVFEGCLDTYVTSYKK